MSFDEYRSSVRARWPNAFAIASEALSVLEPAVATERTHADELFLALDMLFVQSYKGLASVVVLVEHGHTEDAATITRRLLELGCSAGYMGYAEPEEERRRRSRRFLAALWNELEADARQRVPPQAAQYWQAIADGVPRTGALPSFQAILAGLGHKDTYDQDYRFLSQIAHGASPDQLLAFSGPRVVIRPLTQLGTVLVFGVRYAMASATVWDDYYSIIPRDAIATIQQRVTDWVVE